MLRLRLSPMRCFADDTAPHAPGSRCECAWVAMSIVRDEAGDLSEQHRGSSPSHKRFRGDATGKSLASNERLKRSGEVFCGRGFSPDAVLSPAMRLPRLRFLKCAMRHESNNARRSMRPRPQTFSRLRGLADATDFATAGTTGRTPTVRRIALANGLGKPQHGAAARVAQVSPLRLRAGAPVSAMRTRPAMRGLLQGKGRVSPPRADALHWRRHDLGAGEPDQARTPARSGEGGSGEGGFERIGGHID